MNIIENKIIENVSFIKAEVKDAKEFRELLHENIIAPEGSYYHDEYKLCNINGNYLIVWQNQKGFVHYIQLTNSKTHEHYRINTRKNTLDYVDYSYATRKEMLKICVNTDKSKLN